MLCSSIRIGVSHPLSQTDRYKHHVLPIVVSLDLQGGFNKGIIDTEKTVAAEIQKARKDLNET